MKHIKSLTLTLTAIAAATAAHAVTMVANFDGTHDDYDAPLSFQTYYDVSGEADFEITSTYGFWNSGYADLAGVIYNSINSVLSIEIRALTGFQVTLDSFQIAPYESYTDTTGYEVADLADTGTSLLSATGLDLDNSTALTISPNLTSANGFLITFGPDAWNNGMDNITFTTSALPTTSSTVPDASSTLALLALGLAGLGFAARKRK